MTQEQLDTLVEMWCLTAQESMGDYELVRYDGGCNTRCAIKIINPNVENVSLPWEYIKNNFTPKEKAKIVISLLEQIIENCDQWLRDEENYHGDKLAEKWDNDRKERLEND